MPLAQQLLLLLSLPLGAAVCALALWRISRHAHGRQVQAMPESALVLSTFAVMCLAFSAVHALSIWDAALSGHIARCPRRSPCVDVVWDAGADFWLQAVMDWLLMITAAGIGLCPWVLRHIRKR